MIQKQILDVFKMTSTTPEIMKGPLQNPYAQNIVQTIAQFSLQTRILIDFKNGEAQIVEISKSTVNDMRDIDFGAIGSGSLIQK